MKTGQQGLALGLDPEQRYQLCLAKIQGTDESVLFPPPPEVELLDSTHVIIETRFGIDLARVCGFTRQNEDLPFDRVRFLRLASEIDLERSQELSEKEGEALEVFREKIEGHGLDMKPVQAHFMLDEDKLILYFVADQRVDFRALVRDLVSCFHVRIELRQIGVRDEARMLGGRGVCGRCFCCKGISENLQPVSIKMAKMQNLSLNSKKVSGPCGRLMCCLAFEYEAYLDEFQRLPREGDNLICGDQRLRVVEVNPISRNITAQGREGQRVSVSACSLHPDQRSRTWFVDAEGCGSNCKR